MAASQFNRLDIMSGKKRKIFQSFENIWHKVIPLKIDFLEASSESHRGYNAKEGIKIGV